jgi:hypothetical protein
VERIDIGQVVSVLGQGVGFAVHWWAPFVIHLICDEWAGIEVEARSLGQRGKKGSAYGTA